jgi:thioredoxin 1
MAGNISSVTSGNFEQEVMKSSTPVLVDFWAEWCGPCKSLAPYLEQFATEYAGKIKICKVNVDEDQQLASQYRIVSIPTLLIIKNGQVVEQMVGFRGPKDLKAKLDAALA